MTRTRAYRRYKLVVKKKNCARYHVSSSGNHVGPQTDKKIVGRVAAAPKSCDGWCCNKPRKNHGELFSDIRNKQRVAHYE